MAIAYTTFGASIISPNPDRQRLIVENRCKDTTKIWNEQILEQKKKIYFIIECFLGGIWEFTHDRLPKNSQ